jgi:hypothetical protein
MEDIEGLLLVDLQPAYLGRGKSGLMERVFEHIEALPADTPLMAMYVHEELSNNFLEDVQDFWRDQGASEELIDRIQWVEKDYAFLRGWMDNGVDDETIVSVLQTMQNLRKTDSRDLDESLLEELARRRPRYDPLIASEYVYEAVRAMRRKASRWFTCGGGLHECLKEVELVLDAQRVNYSQLAHLTY